MAIKFTQIVTGMYETPGTDSKSRRLNHALYGLSANGNVYKYEHAKGAWIRLSGKDATEDNVVSRPRPKQESRQTGFGRTSQPISSSAVADDFDDDVPF